MQTLTMFCIALIAATALAARGTAPSRYRVLLAYPPGSASTDLNQAADQGYKLLFASRYAIMRLDAVPPETYRYLPIPSQGGDAGFLNALNQAGALGYGWLKDTPFLQKEPHPRNYEYIVANTFSQKSLKQAHESALAQAYRLAGDLGGRQIYIRELGNTQPVPNRRPVRIVDAFRTANQIKDISELAAHGYRFRSPELIGRGSIAVLMEECDSTCGGPFEYRVFDLKETVELERDLNALGRDGFRVLPETLDRKPHLAERQTSSIQRFAYRAFDAADDLGAAEQAVNASAQDGFVPIGFAGRVGLYMHWYIVMEKVTASAVP
jgi:hypothetical protein